MGVEGTVGTDTPYFLIQSDPDYFDFILGILATGV